MVLRVCFCFGLLASILLMPFWFSLILLVVGIALFPSFWEGPVLFLLLDALHGVRETKFLSFVFVCAAIALCALVLLELLKKKLKFYRG